MEEKSVVPPAKDKQQIMQLIVFRIGDEEFGVPIHVVQEIIKIATITPIPDSPDFIKGLINVRGDIVAVIDVRARFALAIEEEMSRHIVIVKQGENLFGLMVNEVMEVLRVQESDIKSPPHLMTTIQEDYVSGVITHDSRLIILLDVEKVLAEDELARLTTATRSQRNKNGKSKTASAKADAATDAKKKPVSQSKKKLE